MKKSSLSSCVVYGATLAVVACVGHAGAATRAHWSFDGTVGTTFEQGDTIVDVSATGTHPLTVGK